MCSLSDAEEIRKLKDQLNTKDAIIRAAENTIRRAAELTAKHAVHPREAMEIARLTQLLIDAHALIEQSDDNARAALETCRLLQKTVDSYRDLNGRLEGSKACLNVEIGQVRNQLRTAIDMQLRYQRERDFYRSEKPDLDAELRHQYAEGFQAGRDYIPNRGD